MNQTTVQKLIDLFNENSKLTIQGLKKIFNEFNIDFEEQERSISEMRNHDPMSKGPKYITAGMNLYQISTKPEEKHNTICELTGLSDFINPKFQKKEIQKYFDLQFGSTIEAQIIEVIKQLRLIPSDVKDKQDVINGTFIQEWKMIESNGEMKSVTLICQVCPKNITTLGKLKSFYFIGNIHSGSPLPNIISSITQLEKLDITRASHISDLRNLKNLKSLSIDNFGWESLPEWIIELNLKKLRLVNGRNLETLPENWGNLEENLEKLKLIYCHKLNVTETDLKKKLRKCRSIRIYHCGEKY